MARIVDAIGRVREKRLSCIEAAELLGMSERHFRRLRDSYEEGGAEAIVDRRRGRPASNKAPDETANFVADQYRTKYFDFTPKHFHEALCKAHPEFRYGYTWTKSVLYLRGLVKPSSKRGPHRRRRPRSALPGMLVFQDGSTHDWFCGRRAPCDLIVTLDDATGRILSAFFCEQEGTASTFRGLAEAIEKYGLFSAFYTDRGSHYFNTPEAGGKVDRNNPTQVGRALAQLRINHIPSYSPEARGRMERVFGTLQGRLPQDMRLARINDIETANAWLRDVYIAQHNARFSVAAEEDGSAFIPFVGDLANILCIHEERVVSKDNTVRYEGRILQIPEHTHRRHFVKASVRVQEYPDGRLAIFHGPRLLARYEAVPAPKTHPGEKSETSAA
ncbi:MAG: ISNCY family transposase [Alphaproteobacteria bacterium]|nr:ISNCY family transposase [Alphaproteobacteria bacterium]